MSEHETTSRPGPGPEHDLGLTDADLGRAYATSVERGTRLLRYRNQRRAAFSGLGVAVLLVGGFGVLQTLSDDDGSPVVVTPAGQGGNKESVPATSTTTTPSVPTTTLPPIVDAASWSRTVEGDVEVFTNPEAAPDPTVDAGGGVALGGGESMVRAAELVSAGRIGTNEIQLTIACERSSADHVDEVRLLRIGNEITVQVSITGIMGGDDCTGAAGSGVRLPVSGDPLPNGGVSIEAGLLDQ